MIRLNCVGAYSPSKYDFKIDGLIEDVASHFECYYLETYFYVKWLKSNSQNYDLHLGLKIILLATKLGKM